MIFLNFRFPTFHILSEMPLNDLCFSVIFNNWVSGLIATDTPLCSIILVPSDTVDTIPISRRKWAIETGSSFGLFISIMSSSSGISLSLCTLSKFSCALAAASTPWNLAIISFARFTLRLWDVPCQYVSPL